MIFKRTQHDGLYAVLNRQGFKKIIFNNGIYETTDQEECNTLFDMGYAYEGEMPAAKKGKKSPKLEEHPVTIMGDTGEMPPEVKSAAIKWQVIESDSEKILAEHPTKKKAEEWILAQDNWEDLEVKKG